MARIVAVSPDLMLASRIEATLSAAGHEVTLASSLDAAQLDSADLVIADLDGESPAAIAGLGMPALGYYQHTKAETREAAEAAGVDLVVPRSRLAREMPELVAGLLD